MLLGGDFVGRVQLGMEVEEVDNHTLYGIHQCIVAEMMVGLLQPSLHGLEILAAYLLLIGLQLHDGVLKQKELSAHAIVALGCGHLNELLRYIDDIHTEILALLQVHHQVPTASYNQAVASLETECLSIALERAISIVAIGVAEIVGKLCLTDSLQCVVYDYMLNRFHWIILGSHFYFNLLNRFVFITSSAIATSIAGHLATASCAMGSEERFG